MLFLIAEILVAGLIVLALYDLKRYFGLALLFIFVGSNQFIQNVVSATVYHELLGRFPVSPGSAALFSSTLLALLLVYLKEDVPTARRLIYGVVSANLAVTLIVAVTRWGLISGRLVATAPASDWFRTYDLQLHAIGTALLVADAFLVLILCELLADKARWLPVWGRAALSLCLVLSFDSAAFILLGMGGQPGARELLVGQLLGKNLAGITYGLLLGAYLGLRQIRTVEKDEQTRDTLSIFTYREQVQQLLEEKKTAERERDLERRRAEVAARGAGLGLWDWNIQTGATFLDDTWAQMLGYSRAEVVPRIDSWKQRVHPADRAVVEEALNAHLEGASPSYEVEHRLRTKYGRWKWILSVGEVVEHDENGQPLRMSGAHFDIDRRKRMEVALRESQLRYELATTAARVGVWDWNLENDHIYVDPRLKALLGYQDHEIQNRLDDWGRYVHPDDAERVMAEATAHLEGRKPRYEVEHRMLHRDGSSRWFLAQGTAQRSPDGKPLRVIGTDTDITEAKAAERKLERLERRYRELFEQAPLMYVITSHQDRVPLIEDCNVAFLEALGYEREEVVGLPLGDFYTQESRVELMSEHGYRLTLEAGLNAVERQLVTKSGAVVETMLRALPEKNPVGDVVGTRAMYVDITARKWAERALRESQGRLAEAQRVARVGSWEVDPASGENRWSDEHYRLFGVDPEAFATSYENYLSCVHPEDRSRVSRTYEKARATSEPFSIDYRIVRPDGKVRDLHTEGRWEIDSEGKVIRLHGTAQDITERKRAEVNLERSRRQLRRLAARLEAIREEERTVIGREIHDELGQALTGLKMDVAWIGKGLTDRQAELAERTKSMSSLVDQTIETVRDLSARLRPAVLDDLGLREAVEWQAQDFSRRSGIESRVRQDEGDLNLTTEQKTTVFRILQEALTNVARHADAGRVDVLLRRAGGRLVLEVTDDGRGIAQEEVTRESSLGILGMRERAEILGGGVRVGPAEGLGTRVALEIPI